jgi:hypothetical protein
MGVPWEIVLVLLIPVGVWLLTTILRSEEDRNRRSGGRPGGDGAPRGPGRRPVTDLDRFLEEARRRREASERQSRQALGPPPSAELEDTRLRVPGRRSEPPPPPLAPRVEPLRQAPPRPAPQPVGRSPERRPPAPRATVLPPVPVPPPVARPAPPPEQIPVEVVPGPPPTPSAPARPASPVTPRKDAEQLAALLKLLRSPQTARTAIVLREVFDQPLCRRRRM